MPSPTGEMRQCVCGAKFYPGDRRVCTRGYCRPMGTPPPVWPEPVELRRSAVRAPRATRTRVASDPERDERIRALRAQGQTFRQIGAAIGMSHGSVRAICVRGEDGSL